MSHSPRWRRFFVDKLIRYLENYEPDTEYDNWPMTPDGFPYTERSYQRNLLVTDSERQNVVARNAGVRSHEDRWRELQSI